MPAPPHRTIVNPYTNRRVRADARKTRLTTARLIREAHPRARAFKRAIFRETGLVPHVSARGISWHRMGHGPNPSGTQGTMRYTGRAFRRAVNRFIRTPNATPAERSRFVNLVLRNQDDVDMVAGQLRKVRGDRGVTVREFREKLRQIRKAKFMKAARAVVVRFDAVFEVDTDRGKEMRYKKMVFALKAFYTENQIFRVARKMLQGVENDWSRLGLRGGYFSGVQSLGLGGHFDSEVKLVEDMTAYEVQDIGPGVDTTDIPMFRLEYTRMRSGYMEYVQHAGENCVFAALRARYAGVPGFKKVFKDKSTFIARCNNGPYEVAFKAKTSFAKGLSAKHVLNWATSLNLMCYPHDRNGKIIPGNTDLLTRWREEGAPLEDLKRWWCTKRFPKRARPVLAFQVLDDHFYLIDSSKVMSISHIATVHRKNVRGGKKKKKKTTKTTKKSMVDMPVVRLPKIKALRSYRVRMSLFHEWRDTEVTKLYRAIKGLELKEPTVLLLEADPETGGMVLAVLHELFITRDRAIYDSTAWTTNDRCARIQYGEHIILHHEHYHPVKRAVGILNDEVDARYAKRIKEAESKQQAKSLEAARDKARYSFTGQSTVRLMTQYLARSKRKDDGCIQRHQSMTSEAVRNLFLNAYSMRPVPFFEQYKTEVPADFEGTEVAFDIKRCYTSCLMNDEEHPWIMLDPLSEPEEYVPTGDGLLLPGFYYAHAELDMPMRGSRWYSYDHLLECAKRGIKFEITHQLLASHTLPADYFRDFVTKCYQIFGDKLAKNPVNMLVGMLYQQQKRYVDVKFRVSGQDAKLDFWEQAKLPFMEKDTGVFRSVKQNEVRVNELSATIYVQIIQRGWLKLFDMCEKLRGAGCKILGGRTDGVIVLVPYGLDLTTIIGKGKARIGGIRIEDKAKDVTLYPDPMRNSADDPLVARFTRGGPGRKRAVPCEYLERAIEKVGGRDKLDLTRVPLVLPERKWERITEEDLGTPGDPDGTNQAEVARYIVGCGRSCCLLGKAGYGKTRTLKHVAELLAEKKVAWLCPTNAAARNLEDAIGGEVQTIHKYIAFNPNGQMCCDFHKRFRSVEYIVIDEFSMLDPLLLHVLRTARIANPELVVVCVGDDHQIPGIYMKGRSVYDTQIFWEICGGLTVELTIYRRGDKRLGAFLDTFIETGKLAADLGNRTDLETNLCYRNSTRVRVNERCMSRLAPADPASKTVIRPPKIISDNLFLLQPLTLFHGLKVISYKNNSDLGITKADRAVVSGFTAATVSIERSNGEVLEMKHDVFLANYTAGYCTTVHAAQGQTLREPFGIYDKEDIFGDRRLGYTALSRATTLDDINICKLPREWKKARADFKEMCRRYKDMDRGRNDLTPAKLSKLVDQSYHECHLCGGSLTLEAWGLDRLDNDKNHCLANVRPAHTRCNRIRGGRNLTQLE